jgi:hypothetical protein
MSTLARLSGIALDGFRSVNGSAKPNINTINGQNLTAATGISTTNLVAHWDASNTSSYSGSGTSVNDLVGSANLTLANGATYSNTGGIDRFVLDGVNDDIGTSGTPTSLQFQFSDPMSIGMWLYPHFNDSAGFGIFTGNPYNTGSFEGVSVVNGGSGDRLRPRFWMRASSSSYILMSMNAKLTQNSWQYLMVTYNGVKGTSGTKFYLNGSEVTGTTGSSVGSSTTISHSQDFQIGSRQTVNAFYDGEVADVHYYNSEISSSTVLSNYNATKSKFGL